LSYTISCVLRLRVVGAFNLLIVPENHLTIYIWSSINITKRRVNLRA